MANTSSTGLRCAEIMARDSEAERITVRSSTRFSSGRTLNEMPKGPLLDTYAYVRKITDLDILTGKLLGRSS